MKGHNSKQAQKLFIEVAVSAKRDAKGDIILHLGWYSNYNIVAPLPTWHDPQ